MKSALLSLGIFFAAFFLNAQQPADIVLKDGRVINAYHFGQYECNNIKYFDFGSSIIIRGKYENIVTDIKKYKDIKRVYLVDFDEDPVTSVGNEKATIIILKKNGVEVTLSEATISLSCYGGMDKYNQLKFQEKNPIDDKVYDRIVDTKDIKYIEFAK